MKGEKNKNFQIWNKGLTAISIINIFALLFVVYWARDSIDTFYGVLIVCVFLYTVVCAIRSIWPRIDADCICAYKNNISSPFLGRSLATVAELSFVLFIVLINDKILSNPFLEKNNKNYIFKMLNYLLFPLIALAQILCWIGVTTNEAKWNAAEESLWAILGVIIMIIYTYILLLKYPSQKLKSIQSATPFILISLAIFIYFMVFVDIPMYLDRSKNFKGKYDLINSGMNRMMNCKKVSKSYKYWKDEIPWMSLYFTIAVWTAIIVLAFYKYYKNLKN